MHLPRWEAKPLLQGAYGKLRVAHRRRELKRIRSGCGACSKLLPQILHIPCGAAVTDLRKPAPVHAQGLGVPSWAFGVVPTDPEPLLVNCDVLDKLREAGYNVGAELGRGTYGRRAAVRPAASPGAPGGHGTGSVSAHA